MVPVNSSVRRRAGRHNSSARRFRSAEPSGTGVLAPPELSEMAFITAMGPPPPPAPPQPSTSHSGPITVGGSNSEET